MIWLMKLPAAGSGQPTRLDVTGDGSEIVWTRCIGRSVLQTRQRADGSRLVERSGVGRVSFDLAAQDAALLYRNSSFQFAGIRIPSTFSPHAAAVVSPTPDGWHVAVTITWRERIVCRYSGRMRSA